MHFKRGAVPASCDSTCRLRAVAPVWSFGICSARVLATPLGSRAHSMASWLQAGSASDQQAPQPLPFRGLLEWRLPRKLRKRGYTFGGHCTVPCSGMCGFACGRPVAAQKLRPHKTHECQLCHVGGPNPEEGQWPWRKPLSWELPERLHSRGFRISGWCKEPCIRGCGFACSHPLPSRADFGHNRAAAEHVCAVCRGGASSSASYPFSISGHCRAFE